MSEKFIRGEGVFEITDYTTATDWERFTSGLEDILTEWQLNKQSESKRPPIELPDGFISSGLWHEKRDTLRFSNVTFDIRYQYLDDSKLDLHSTGLDRVAESGSADEGQATAKGESHNDVGPEKELEDTDALVEKEKEHQEHELPEDLPECLRDIISAGNDFASKAHCLVRWYGFRRFIVLIPRGDTIMSENRVKLILSSASIALANVDCHIPMFVQIHNPKNHFYQGVSEHSNIRTMYEMVYLRQNIKKYEYLSELISLMREKTSCNLSDPVSATIRLNYCISNFDLFMAHHEEWDGNEYVEEGDEKMGQKKECEKKESERDESEQSKSSIENRRERVDRMRSQDMRSGATFDQVKDALGECLPHPFRILKFIHVAALWPPVSDKVITDSSVHSDLDPAEAPIWTIRCVTSDNCNMRIVHETQAIYDLFKASIKWAYEKLDASQIFGDNDRERLQAECLRVSYELAVKPEVILSRSPTDNIRKLVALWFYRAAEISADLDALDQIALQVRMRPSLSEVYRDLRRIKTSVKEFIIRTQISRPFNPIQAPALPQRMFCTICDEEFRLCGAFSELCN